MAKVIVHIKCIQKGSMDIVLNIYFWVPQKKKEKNVLKVSIIEFLFLGKLFL